MGSGAQTDTAAAFTAVASSLAAKINNTVGTVSLTNSTVLKDVVTASAATGSAASIAQITSLSNDIAQMISDNNGSIAAILDSGGSATTMMTQIAQVATVAQGDATAAIQNAATTGSTDLATVLTDYSGSAFDTLVNTAPIGDVSGNGTHTDPIPITPPPDNPPPDNPPPDNPPPSDTTPPTATLAYSTDGGTTTSSTATVSDPDTLRIIATFSEAVTDNTPTITINNGILSSATAMTKTDSTHYYYDLNVPLENTLQTATVTIGGARDAANNTISATPTNPTFAVYPTLDFLGGTIQAPASFDAATAAFTFTDSAGNANFTDIINFSANDSIHFTNGGANHLIVANNGPDVVFTVNNNGTVSQVTLVDVVLSTDLIGSLAAFNAIAALGDVSFS